MTISQCVPKIQCLGMSTIKSGRLTPSYVHFLCLNPECLQNHLLLCSAETVDARLTFVILSVENNKFQSLTPSTVEILCLTDSENHVTFSYANFHHVTIICGELTG